MEIFDLFVHCDEMTAMEDFTPEELDAIFYGGITIEPTD